MANITDEFPEGFAPDSTCVVGRFVNHLDAEALEWWSALPVAERARLTVRLKDKTPEYVYVASGQLYREFPERIRAAATAMGAALGQFAVSARQAQEAAHAFQAAVKAKRPGSDEHRRMSMRKPTSKPWDR